MKRKINWKEKYMEQVGINNNLVLLCKKFSKGWNHTIDEWKLTIDHMWVDYLLGIAAGVCISIIGVILFGI